MKAARPRVLMVGPWPPTCGGVTTFMRNVAGSALRERYEFVPFTTSRPGKRKLSADNYGGYAAILRGGALRVAQGIAITAYHLLLYPWMVLLRRPALIQVQASDFHAFWEAALYVAMGRIFRRRVALRIGGCFDRFWESSGVLARAAIRWTLRQPALLIVQSEYWKRYVSPMGRAGPTVVLNNFVSEGLVERRRAPAPAVPRLLLYCGESPRRKGAYVLLEALRRLDAHGECGARVQVTLMAVPGFVRDDVRRAGLDGAVRMLDFLAHDEALAELGRTDVFLQVSSGEGFPNMLLEAMALGCAAIVTPVGAVPEVVGPDGECAFIVPAGDARALAERMARLAADPALLARMAAAARRRVAERFTERAVIGVLDSAYRSLI
jgi:glycosyltransferase involved in cell wall biosynthesis